MNLLCIGISHHTAPLDIRERLWFSTDEIRRTLPLLKPLNICECVLFSTCNRTELYAMTENGDILPDTLKDFLINQKSAKEKVLPSDMFTITAGESARHLFSVTASIDSMVPGDVQILSQVKEGFNIAVELGTAGIFMNRLFQLAFRVGKRTRTETEIGDGAVSISYAAVELAEKIFENINKKTALIIGAGETSELTAVHLNGKNIGRIFITNRTFDHSEKLALKVKGTAIPFDSWSGALAVSDIVISSVEADRYILKTDHIKKITRKNKNGPLCVIDLGVPRNIDPEIKKLDNVFLYDLDSLNSMINENLQHRKKEIPRVESIISEVLEELNQWYSSLEINPTITALTKFMESIRQEEVAKNINRFEPKDRELVELITRRIINKIIHKPIENLKEEVTTPHNGRLQKMNIVQKLFGLAKSSKEDDYAG